MILWDLLKLHTGTNTNNFEIVIYMGGNKEVYPLDSVPYACLIEKISMWELEIESEDKVNIKIWLH